MKRVSITYSVGKNGVNIAPDVASIAAALVAVGPARGGTQWPATSLAELEKAIERFQIHEKQYARLRIIDGRIDPNGSTLRCLNAHLDGDVISSQPPPPRSHGTLTFLQGRPDLPRTVVDQAAPTPAEASLTRDFLFDWTTVFGQGKIYYFELTEDVVPKWYGLLLPNGTVNFNHIHLFFHPTPGQAGYQASTYFQLGSWSKIFRYLWNPMGAAFCAAATGRVLIMPLMTDNISATCGILMQRWDELFSQMLSMVQANDGAAFAPRVSISSIIVSSFSSGITYSHHFRQNANLGSRLAGVIDFDGLYSASKAYCPMLIGPAGKVVKAYQMFAEPKTIQQLASQNIFPLPQARMKPPYDKKTPNQIHGGIPQFMMYIAEKRLR